MWGEDVKLMQDSLADSNNNMAPLEAVIAQQTMAAKLSVAAQWKAKFGEQFPKLQEVAICLLTMAVGRC